jgi:chromosome segregation ATPase
MPTILTEGVRMFADHVAGHFTADVTEKIKSLIESRAKEIPVEQEAKRLRDHVAALQVQVGEYERANNNARINLDRLTSAVVAHRTRVETLEAELSAKKNECNRLRRTNVDLAKIAEQPKNGKPGGVRRPPPKRALDKSRIRPKKKASRQPRRRTRQG